MKRMDFLIIGDSHIPDREKIVPKEIRERIITLRKELPKNYFDHIFFTGDFTDSDNFFNLLKESVGGDLDKIHIVLGNMDPFYKATGKINSIKRFFIFKKEFKIGRLPMVLGLIHGHQIRPRGNHRMLMRFAIEKGFTILITGHTHADDISLLGKEVLMINPGSCTGSWSFLATGAPSFVQLKLEEDMSQSGKYIKATTRLFLLNQSEKKIEMIENIFRYDGARWSNYVIRSKL